MSAPKAREAIDHLASFQSIREEISQPGIESPTSSLRFGCLSTIIQQFRVVLDDKKFKNGGLRLPWIRVVYVNSSFAKMKS